jgi:Mg2+ and Co2+ transporter CorA
MRSGASAVDEQVNALTEALNLTADQQTRIRSILEDQHQQAVGVINDPSLSHDAKLQKVHALRQSTIDKVRGTLSSDDQKSKFDSMIQASNERLRQREQQEQQQNNTPPPK